MKGKKWMGSLLIGGAVVSLLSLSAMAAEKDNGFRIVDVPATISIIPQNGAGEAVTGELVDGVMTYMGARKLAVTTTGPVGEYVVLLVEGNVETPTEDSTICYINQAENENGTVSFSVYPSAPNAGELTLFITSNVADTQRATLEYVTSAQEYLLGDVNEDQTVNALDSLSILKYVAQTETLSASQLQAGDVTGDGRVNALDSLEILKYVAKLPNMVDGTAE